MTDDETATETREKIPFSEAMDMINMAEISMIETHYRKLTGTVQHFGGQGDTEMAPMATMAGTIWALEKRRLGKGYSWDDADRMTLKEANAYFAEEPVDVDEDDPDSESGKDDAPAISAPESEPPSAPY